jgi:hypothetical protein
MVFKRVCDNGDKCKWSHDPKIIEADRKLKMAELQGVQPKDSRPGERAPGRAAPGLD